MRGRQRRFSPVTLQDPGDMTAIIPPLVSHKRHRPEGFLHTDAFLAVFKCVCVCVMLRWGCDFSMIKGIVKQHSLLC